MDRFLTQIQQNINDIDKIGQDLTQLQAETVLFGDKLIVLNTINQIVLVYGYVVKRHMEETLGYKEIIINFGILYNRLKKIEKNDDFFNDNLGGESDARILRNKCQHALSPNNISNRNYFPVEMQIKLINHTIKIIKSEDCILPEHIDEKFSNDDLVLKISNVISSHEIDMNIIGMGISQCFSFLHNSKVNFELEKNQILSEICEIVLTSYSLLATTPNYNDIAFTNDLLYQKIKELPKGYNCNIIAVLNKLPKHPKKFSSGVLVPNAKVYIEDYTDALTEYVKMPNQENLCNVYYNARDIQYILGYGFHNTTCLPLYLYQIFDKFGLYIYLKYKDSYIGSHSDKEHYFKNIQNEIVNNNLTLTDAEKQMLIFDYNLSNTIESQLYKVLNAIRQKIEHKMDNPLDIEKHHDLLFVFEKELMYNLIPKIGNLVSEIYDSQNSK